MKKLLIISLLLSGCATPVFIKPGQMFPDETKFNKDAYECRQQAGAGSMNNEFTMRRLLWQCMESKGYVKQ